MTHTNARLKFNIDVYSIIVSHYQAIHAQYYVCDCMAPAVVARAEFEYNIICSFVTLMEDVTL